MFSDLYDLRVFLRPYTAISGSVVHARYNSRMVSFRILWKETKRVHCPKKVLKGPPWRHSPACHNGFPDGPTYLFPSSIIRQCRLYSYRSKTAIVPFGSIYGAQHSCHVNKPTEQDRRKRATKKNQNRPDTGGLGNQPKR